MKSSKTKEMEEVRQMKKICEKALADISMHNGSRKEFLEKAARNEQKIDDLEEMYLLGSDCEPLQCDVVGNEQIGLGVMH